MLREDPVEEFEIPWEELNHLHRGILITPGSPMALKNYVGALIEAPFAAYLAIYWTPAMLYALGLLVLGDSLKKASIS